MESSDGWWLWAPLQSLRKFLSLLGFCSTLGPCVWKHNTRVGLSFCINGAKRFGILCQRPKMLLVFESKFELDTVFLLKLGSHPADYLAEHNKSVFFIHFTANLGILSVLAWIRHIACMFYTHLSCMNNSGTMYNFVQNCKTRTQQTNGKTQCDNYHMIKRTYYVHSILDVRTQRISTFQFQFFLNLTDRRHGVKTCHHAESYIPKVRKLSRFK